MSESVPDTDSDHDSDHDCTSKLIQVLKSMDASNEDDIRKNVQNISNMADLTYAERNTLLQAAEELIRNTDFTNDQAAVNTFESDLIISNLSMEDNMLVNPSKTEVSYTQFNISSANRSLFRDVTTVDSITNTETTKPGSTSAALNTNFDFIPNGNSLHNVTKLSLKSIYLPTTWYVFEYRQGTTAAILYMNNGNDPEYIIIPDGNYTATELANALAVAINAILGGAGTVTFSVDTVSGRLKGSFTSTDPATLNEIIIEYYDLNSEVPQQNGNTISVSNKNLGHHLGFRSPSKINPLSSSTKKSSWIKMIHTTDIVFIGHAPIDVRGPRYFFLLVDDFSNHSANQMDSGVRSSYYGTNRIQDRSLITFRNVLAKINLDTADIDISSGKLVITEELHHNIRHYHGPITIEKLHIMLVDERGLLVDLHDIDWSCTLSLETSYLSGKDMNHIMHD